ncbi:MAG TPA: alanyl-tRNA editing protein, partial [Rhabdochlamydiaceae bacterium]
MKTDPLYLTDPYLKEVEATIIDFIEPDRIILDQTIFYPMGGGQPTDQGTIVFENGEKAEVYQVLVKDGEINHFIKSQHKPSPGEKIKGTLNWERRFKHMRLHSAGHIIDFALFLLGYSPSPLSPLKGD